MGRGSSIERAGGQTPLVRNRQIFAKGEVDGEGARTRGTIHPPSLRLTSACTVILC